MTSSEQMRAHLLSVPALAAIWQSALRNAEHPPVTLKGQQFGQLKHLRHHLQNRAPEVLRWASQNWLRFTARAVLEAGLTASPSVPHIGFLLANIDSALRGIEADLGRDSSPTLQHLPPLPLRIETPAPPPPHRMTDEEFYAMMDGLK